MYFTGSKMEEGTGTGLMAWGNMGVMNAVIACTAGR